VIRGSTTTLPSVDSNSYSYSYMGNTNDGRRRTGWPLLLGGPVPAKFETILSFIMRPVEMFNPMLIQASQLSFQFAVTHFASKVVRFSPSI
jgi:hypothetical protein